MKDFRRIIAATDLSDCSAAALTYAKAIARKSDAELTVLHANVIAPLIDGVQSNLAYAAAYQLDGAREALDEFATTYLGDVPAAQKLVVTGPAPETILSTSRVLDADLIVLGTRGSSGIRRVLLGSVAEAVVRQSDRPVMTIRCSMPEAAQDGSVFRRILCPIHYGRSSGRAFEHALALASLFDAELIVVYVAEEAHGVLDVENEIERLRAWIGDVPMPVRVKLLVNRGNAAEQVIFYAKQHAVDLLVIGSRVKSAGAQTVIGSTTEMLTRHAPCPVLTVIT